MHEPRLPSASLELFSSCFLVACCVCTHLSFHRSRHLVQCTCTPSHTHTSRCSEHRQRVLQDGWRSKLEQKGRRLVRLFSPSMKEARERESVCVCQREKKSTREKVKDDDRHQEARGDREPRSRRRGSRAITQPVRERETKQRFPSVCVCLSAVQTPKHRCLSPHLFIM